MDKNYIRDRYWGQVVAGIIVGLALCVLWGISEAVRFVIKAIPS